MLYAGVEISWRWSIYSTKKLGAEINDATVAAFGFYASIVPLLGRIMQGSAETVAESILFEIAGTFAELTLADSLLKSRTPLGDTYLMFRRKNNKVTPAKTRLSLKGDESLQRSFCEQSMMMLTISEAAALLTSTLFWLLLDANPGKPGSPKIPIAQTLSTLAVMLVGEFIFTDGIIAYASNKYKERYIVDLSAAWQDLRTKKNKLIWYLVLIISAVSVPVMGNLPINLCYTSPIDDMDNFALTSCPEIPRNITEMSRVSEQYQALWEKYKNNN